MRIVQLEGESLIAAVRRPAFAHEWVEYPGTLPGQVVERLRGGGGDHQQGAARCHGNRRAARTEDDRRFRHRHQQCRSRRLPGARYRRSNIRGYAGHVPEHVMALLLALSRNLVAWRETLLAGAWQQSSSSACSTTRSATCTAPRSA
jgi:glycerate dehydrogenase